LSDSSLDLSIASESSTRPSANSSSPTGVTGVPKTKFTSWRSRPPRAENFLWVSGLSDRPNSSRHHQLVASLQTSQTVNTPSRPHSKKWEAMSLPEKRKLLGDTRNFLLSMANGLLFRWSPLNRNPHLVRLPISFSLQRNPQVPTPRQFCIAQSSMRKISRLRLLERQQTPGKE